MGDRAFNPEGRTNVPHQKQLYFKAALATSADGVLAAAPLNDGIVSIVHVSTGLYRITLRESYRYHVHTDATLNKSAADGGSSTKAAHGGPVANFGTGTPATVDIFILDEDGAVADPPAANANNFLSGSITVCDVAAV